MTKARDNLKRENKKCRIYSVENRINNYECVIKINK